ncbi:MAG: hypothetical protein AAF727_16855, partial [Pseudomonadota bacterium]
MTVNFVTASVGGSGVQFALATGDDLILDAGVTVYSEDIDVVRGSGSNTIFLNANSSLVALNTSFIAAAIDLSGDGNSSVVTISQTAAVFGDIYSEHILTKVTNFGSISGGLDGVDLRGTNGVITNFGDISAAAAAAEVDRSGLIINHGSLVSEGTGAFFGNASGTLRNSGTIDSTIGVRGNSEKAASDRYAFTNSGTITASEAAIQINSSTATIVNSGTITTTSTSKAALLFQSNALSLSAPNILVNTGEILGHVRQA